MTKQQQDFDNEFLNRAIAELVATGESASKLAEKAIAIACDEVVGIATEMGHTGGKNAQVWAEQVTETTGRLVTPIAENPFIKYATKIPGVNWLLAALGQVDIEKTQADVEKLRQDYPRDNNEQLARRVILDTALKAGGIGLATNILPPLALGLFGVDLVAVTALQAEMIYRIAHIYGFTPTEPARRGEVLAIFGLSMGTSGVLKLGVSFVEAIPLIGPVVGASSNAALIYTLGSVAYRFYEAKCKHP